MNDMYGLLFGVLVLLTSYGAQRAGTLPASGQLSVYRVHGCDSLGVDVLSGKGSFRPHDTLYVQVVNAGSDSVFVALGLDGYRDGWVRCVDDLDQFVGRGVRRPRYGNIHTVAPHDTLGFALSARVLQSLARRYGALRVWLQSVVMRGVSSGMCTRYSESFTLH
jgi:hypothetical protein